MIWRVKERIARRDVASPRRAILAATAPLSILLLGVSLVVPTGFALRSPGPTEDTLGTQLRTGTTDEYAQLVEITGAETFPASGRLLLTTVAVSGGPVGSVYPLDVLLGWATQARAVLPVEAVFPTDITREEQEEQSAAQMVSSQEAATAAALTELGYDVPVTLSVASAAAGSGAEGVVEEGDVLVALDGVPITSHLQLVELLGEVPVGEEVILSVLRDGNPVDLPIETMAAQLSDGSQRAALGVFLNSDFVFPIDVQIQIERIGGPSAGMMFALAIIDRLTPADELNGQTVAGTGTVETDGSVGPIGGIEQKMRGALRDGASWFLAPEGNCSDVVGAIPDGLRVVKVATLHEARSAIEAIGAGTAESLPTCDV